MKKKPTTFKMTVNLGNAAFEDDEYELQRILMQTSKKIGGFCGKDYGTVKDINGNTVGKWELK